MVREFRRFDTFNKLEHLLETLKEKINIYSNLHRYYKIKCKETAAVKLKRLLLLVLFNKQVNV